MRLLWLTYERPPHPDAVCHPATEEEADFVLALLRRPYPERMHLTGQLIRFLAEEGRRAPVLRRSLACRTPTGLYRCVPWRLAKWLRHVLPATESAVDHTIARIERWKRTGDANPASGDFVVPICATAGVQASACANGVKVWGKPTPAATESQPEDWTPT